MLAYTRTPVYKNKNTPTQEHTYIYIWKQTHHTYIHDSHTNVVMHPLREPLIFFIARLKNLGYWKVSPKRIARELTHKFRGKTLRLYKNVFWGQWKYASFFDLLPMLKIRAYFHEAKWMHTFHIMKSKSLFIKGIKYCKPFTQSFTIWNAPSPSNEL